MTDCCADGLSSTGGVAGPTHRPAFLVSARMSVKAVIVYPTLDLNTGHIWVSFISVLTSTHRLVFNDSAEGMVSACTRVLADAVYARISFSALVIGAAA